MSSTNQGPAQTLSPNLSPVSFGLDANGVPVFYAGGSPAANSDYLGAFAWASLPAAASYAGYRARVTDRGYYALSDGVSWNALPSAVSASYVGFVADRTRSCFVFSSTNKQWGGRHGVYARDDITPATQMKLVDAGFYTQSTGEITTDQTVAYGIEYPAGTITPVTYSGASSAAVAAGAVVISDPISITIPRGAKFWVRYYKTAVAGMIYVGGSNIPYSDHDNGDFFEFGASGITNKTLSGSFTNTDVTSGFSSPPIAIVGNTRRRSFAIVGDSRATGILDHWGDAGRRRGVVERSIGRYFGNTNFSQSSETTATFNGAAGALRQQIAQSYASDIVVQYGTNDLGSGATTTRLSALFALFPAKRVWATTLGPITTSTDSWATLANQTVAANETERATVNKFIRGQPAGVYGVCDTADVTEMARSGKWNPAYTTDPSQFTAFEGTHDTSIMCQQIAASGAIDPIALGYAAAAL